MFFEYKEGEGYTEVSAETDDICALCKWFDNCPLIGALETHIVYPSCEQLCIEDCPMYEPDFEFDEGSLN